MSDVQTRWTVAAVNTATESENRIHDDDVARRYGFTGGLVPGVVVYAYMAHAAADALGTEWLERGTMSARFARPVYDGERIEVTAAGHVDQLELAVVRPGGEVAATGSAALPASRQDPPDPAHYPEADAPSERPPVTTDVLAGLGPLGSLTWSFHADRAPEYLELIGDDLPLWRESGLAHPGWLIQWANWILTSNVKLGPWIHVESSATHYRAVRDGDRLSLRGRVAELFERKGHRFVGLDLLYVCDEEPVQQMRHTAIYEIRSS